MRSRWAGPLTWSAFFHAAIVLSLLGVIRWRQSHSDFVMNIDLAGSSLLLRPPQAAGRAAGGRVEPWYVGAKVRRVRPLPKATPQTVIPKEEVSGDASAETGTGFLPAAAASRRPQWVLGMISEDDYPSEARAKNQQGTVKVEVSINADGSVREVHIVQGSYPSLDLLVLQKLQKARFQPGLDREGNPVAVRMLIPIVFELH
ncbi:MAG: energy transducer TonB [candidate division FCPU426 bacterium]